MTTGDEYLDSLRLKIGWHRGVITAGEPLREALLFVLLEAMDGAGVLITSPLPELVGSEVLAVNDAYLDILKYDSQEQYQEALSNDPELIHPNDLDMATLHVRHKSSIPYCVRIKRGDENKYRRCQVIGFTMSVNDAEYRLAVLHRD